jgi:hypothetical protein
MLTVALEGAQSLYAITFSPAVPITVVIAHFARLIYERPHFIFAMLIVTLEEAQSSNAKSQSPTVLIITAPEHPSPE